LSGFSAMNAAAVLIVVLVLPWQCQARRIQDGSRLVFADGTTDNFDASITNISSIHGGIRLIHHDTRPIASTHEGPSLWSFGRDAEECERQSCEDASCPLTGDEWGSSFVQQPKGEETSKKIILAIELCRHGARAPYTFATHSLKDAEKDWIGGRQYLSELGQIQHYILGRIVREKYTALGLLSPSYEPGEVFVRASSTWRSMMSANAQMSGLYPTGFYVFGKGKRLNPLQKETLHTVYRTGTSPTGKRIRDVVGAGRHRVRELLTPHYLRKFAEDTGLDLEDVLSTEVLHLNVGQGGSENVPVFSADKLNDHLILAVEPFGCDGYEQVWRQQHGFPMLYKPSPAAQFFMDVYAGKIRRTKKFLPHLFNKTFTEVSNEHLAESRSLEEHFGPPTVIQEYCTFVTPYLRLSDVGDIYVAYKADGRNPPFKIEPELIDECLNAIDTKFTFAWDDEFFPRVASSLLFEFIVGIFRARAYTRCASSTRLMGDLKEFLHSRSAALSEMDPNKVKFILLSGHDGNVLSALSVMDLARGEAPRFAASLFWELWEVKRGQAIQHVIKVSMCGNRDCTLKEFATKIENKMRIWLDGEQPAHLMYNWW